MEVIEGLNLIVKFINQVSWQRIMWVSRLAIRKLLLYVLSSKNFIDFGVKGAKLHIRHFHNIVYVSHGFKMGDGSGMNVSSRNAWSHR